MYFCNAKEFRDFLFNLLQQYMGTATLPGGAVVPAVFVGEPPIGTKIIGIELSIPKDASGNTQSLTGGIAPTSRFEFRLIQHPGSEYLGKAKDAIIQHLTPINYQFLSAVISPIGKRRDQLTLDQYVFTFSRSAMLLRANGVI